jgi:hypothetical protein
MSNARDKANIPALNFSSTGIDDNATSTAITIDSAERVGIGTASPSQLLEIYGTSPNVQWTYSGDGNNHRIFSFSDDFYIRADANNTGAGNLVFQNGGSSERMRINSSGNVGIGTSSPGHKLEVSGNVKANNFTNRTSLQGVDATPDDANRFELGGGFLNLYRDDTAEVNQIQFGKNGTLAAAFSTGGNYLAIKTNGDNERMRIDSSGNLLVGTTTAPNIAGAIHVANSSGHGLQITNTSASKNRRIYVASNGSLYFWNGTNEAYLTDAGAWTNASDERLKNNIRNIEYGLNTVLSTKPRHYERNDVEGTYIGFVAQELQNIIPEVVSGDPDKQLGIDYGSLVAVSFKAIQEQQTIIQELEARITALETNQP